MTPADLASSDPARRAGQDEPATDGPDEPAVDVPSQPTHAGHAALDPSAPVAPSAPLEAPAPLDAPGPLLASGDSTDVFALDDRTVLRRYRSGRDTGAEVALLAHVVAHGFPAPAVVRADGSDLVMERLHGPTLLQALAAGEVSLTDGAAILADLHSRLHALSAPACREGAPLDWPHVPTGSTAGSTVGSAVLHLDLHPGNVILSEEHGPAVVDWANARIGPPDVDVALTALILAEVVVDAGGVYSQAARVLLAAFLAAVDTDVAAALDAAATVRVQDPSLVPGERELVPAAVVLVRELVTVAQRPS